MLKNYSVTDGIVSFMVLLIGAAEAAHLFGTFLHNPFSRCVPVFLILALISLLLLAGITVLLWRKGELKTGVGVEKSRADKLLLLVFLALVLLQVAYVITGQSIYRQGDMTVETVGSFLQNDMIYQVNPLTGRAYEGGIPTRLKLLGLPTMYGVFCSIFHVAPEIFVWRVASVITLVGCYGAYFCVAKSLFPENRCKQRLFLVIVALLLWAGNYELGVDGFNVLSSGWRGVALRNGVLIPYTVSLCLRKKYLHALLCVAAEACIVWTLYGLGACLAVIVGMALTEFLMAHRKVREEDTV